MSDDIHEVFAVCYAGHVRRTAENYIFGDPHDHLSSISYYVWVIKGAHGTWVVDTGFDEIAEKERNRTLLNPVGKSLKALGVEPGKVENVILTHMHWDHAGNYDLFPNARYHVQDTEIAYATADAACAIRCCACRSASATCTPSSEKSTPTASTSMTAPKKELAPGITVHKIGGHSKGLQCVRVKMRRRPTWCSPPTAAISIRTSTRAACSRSPIRSAIRSRATRRCSNSPVRAITLCRATTRRS